MNDKNLIIKIQNDIVNSNPIIITNDDDENKIKNKFSSKYTEDISDSDDDLTSYKNRNIGSIDKLRNLKDDDKNNTTKNIKKSKSKIKKENNSSDNSDKNSINNKDDNNKDDNNKDDDDDDNDEHEYEYANEFKNKVIQYVKHDDRIRELQTELKNLNAIKKNAEAEILKHLDRLGESNINITGGKLRVNKYESKEVLKEEIIYEAHMEKITDPRIIEFIFNKINEKRASGGKVQMSLKRTFERGGKKDDKAK